MLLSAAPTPSPSPITVQLVDPNAAPDWLIPMMTGGFVLAAALITAVVAFLSLKASDKRKLEREDRRQWDRELKAAYVAMAAAVRSVRIAMAQVEPGGHNPNKILDATIAALDVVGEQTLVLELFAEDEVVDAGHDLERSIAVVYERALLASMEEVPDLSWTAGTYSAMDEPLLAVRDRIRSALRVGASK